jgi:hypothetical protein
MTTPAGAQPGPRPDSPGAWAAFRDGLEETSRATEAYRNSNAALAQAAGSIVGRRPAERRGFMVLAPVLQATGNVAEAREALLALEDQEGADIALCFLDRILEGSTGPWPHTPPPPQPRNERPTR